MAGQRCSSSEFQSLSVPAAAAAVRGWAALQQFRVSGFQRLSVRLLGVEPGAASAFSSSEFQRLSVASCPGVGACPASASQQFRVSEFQRLSVPLRRRRGVAGQRCSSSEFQSLSVAAAAAVRGWAALQQFRVSGLQRSRCGGRGACLGSVSVAAVQCFSV